MIPFLLYCKRPLGEASDGGALGSGVGDSDAKARATETIASIK
jgi:hypothetical protein